MSLDDPLRIVDDYRRGWTTANLATEFIIVFQAQGVRAGPFGDPRRERLRKIMIRATIRGAVVSPKLFGRDAPPVLLVPFEFASAVEALPYTPSHHGRGLMRCPRRHVFSVHGVTPFLGRPRCRRNSP